MQLLRFAKSEATKFPLLLCVKEVKLKVSDNNLKWNGEVFLKIYERFL